MQPEQACVPAITAAGFAPSDVRCVLNSHLHLDHTGALGVIDHFPNAEVTVTRTEYEYPHRPDRFAEGAYIKADFKAGRPVGAAGRDRRRVRRLRRRDDPLLALARPRTGHDPDAWPTLKHAPESYG
jgi:glyoxylase-like metal-dependent hydrolase (beta-lactamase superfamily II)